MSYHALYRAYRSKQFRDVIGQVHIVQTMQNALKHERLGHAYLFCGPRGTGKTSIAKIIAKTINCVTYPTDEPCGECVSCKAAQTNTHADIFEIDAASNNGVDEIREIRDKVKYAPTLGAYKVYIIDEVHMLSTGAFNALLKTLEEPPSHVKFILATTEPHKIPATIISRCQRFDFKLISERDIQKHLCNILDDQQIEYELDALTLISSLAEGGMRDALSLLDQVISYSNEKITMDDVHALSGTVTYQSLLQLVVAIQQEDVLTVFDTISLLVDDGKEPDRIVDGLLNLLKELLMYEKLGSQAKLSSLLTELELFKSTMATLNGSELTHFIFKLNKLRQELRHTQHAKLLLQVGLLNLKQQENISSNGEIETLKSEITTLKKTINQLSLEMKEAPKQLKPLSTDQRQFKMEFFDSPETASSLTVTKRPIVEESRVILPEYVIPGTLTIEEVLLNATKADKLKVEQVWQLLNPVKLVEHKEVISLLKEGQIVAASKDGFILTYKFEPACKRLLRDDVKKTASQIVDHLFGHHYNFIIMPDAFWTEQRESFLRQKKNNEKPVLKQYSQEVENVINYKEETAKKNETLLTQVTDWYGEEVINIIDE